MEQEVFLTGYCRCLDQSRLVSVLLEAGKATDIDCSYPDCPHTPCCEIARQLRELLTPPAD